MVIYLINNGVISGEGALDAPYQMHEVMYVQEELYVKEAKDAKELKELKESKDPEKPESPRVNFNVPPDKAAKGPFLFSLNFGPCIAVIARLKSGENAIFHCRMPFKDSLGFPDFVKLVTEDRRDVYVFQKSSPANNKERCPVIAVELSSALNQDVTRVPVEGYFNVLVDAKADKVIFSKNIKFFKASELTALRAKLVASEDKGSVIDVSHGISLEQSVRELQKRQADGFFPQVDIPRAFIERADAVLGPNPFVKEESKAGTSFLLRVMPPDPKEVGKAHVRSLSADKTPGKLEVKTEVKASGKKTDKKTAKVRSKSEDADEGKPRLVRSGARRNLF